MSIRSIQVRLFGALVLVGVIGSMLFVSSRRAGTEFVAQYTTFVVARGEIVQAVQATGQLSPWSSVEISSQISGLVTEVMVDFNTPVKTAQVLARIDPSTYEQKLRQALAELAAVQANQRLMQQRTLRLRGLRTADLVTQQDLDDTEALLEQSNANLLSRRAAVQNARVDLERCTITSPIDGVVIFKQVEVGKTVAASLNAPTLFVIAQDLSKMKVIAPINEADLGLLRVGQGVTFAVDAIPGRTFEGRLVQVRSPYTPSDKQQQQSARDGEIPNFDAVIEVDNRSLLLRASLTVNVSIKIEQRMNALLIPNAALRVAPPKGVVRTATDLSQRKATQDAEATVATVYLLRRQYRKEVPEAILVRLGITDRVSTEVMSGLRAGDRVITGTAAAADSRPPSIF